MAESLVSRSIRVKAFSESATGKGMVWGWYIGGLRVRVVEDESL